MLVQDHGLKENLLDLLQYMCSSGPEGQLGSSEGRQRWELSLAVGRRQSRSCFCQPLAGFGPAAPAGAAEAQNSCKAQHKIISGCKSYQEEGVLKIREPFCSVLIT